MKMFDNKIYQSKIIPKTVLDCLFCRSQNKNLKDFVNKKMSIKKIGKKNSQNVYLFVDEHFNLIIACIDHFPEQRINKFEQLFNTKPFNNFRKKALKQLKVEKEKFNSSLEKL